MNNSPAELAAVALTQFGIDASDDAIAKFVQWAVVNHKARRGRPPKVRAEGQTVRLAAYPLFDHIRAKMGLKNDAALGRFLDFEPPVISKVRSGRAVLTAYLVIRIHEKTGMSVADIKALVPNQA